MNDPFDGPGASSGDARSKATTANTLGTIAVILCLLMSCSGYMSLLMALPLGLAAMQYARTALAESSDEVTTVYARNAFTNGVISVIFSSVFLLFIGAIVLLYGAMIAALVAGNL